MKTKADDFSLSRATGETRKPSKDRKIIHETKVRIDLVRLRDLVVELHDDWMFKGGMRGSEATKEQRSAFSRYNTVRSFASKYDNGEDSIVLETSGGVSGASARVYYFPSITSLCKEFRKCIIPLNEGTEFLFFDLKAAEFFLNCIFCNEVEALQHYWNMEDIYMYYSNLFPVGTDREVIKTNLIANMYGTTPYRVGINCGISENAARRILDNIAARVPRMTNNKMRVISKARNSGVYSCPSFDWESKKFDTSKLIDVYNWREKGEEFKPLLALSAYVQSSLGCWMQQFIHNLSKRTSGTILTVFDSVLVEVKKERKDAAKRWIMENIKPFRTGSITEGDNFYKVYAKEDDENATTFK